MLLAVILGILTLLGGWATADLYMNMIAADVGAQEQGVIFLIWFIPSMAMQFGLIGMGSALRATGIVKPGMFVQMLTVLLNTILAPILIAGWGPGPALGVLGAGLASTLSVSVGIILLILYFLKLEKYVSFQSHLWKPDFKIWQRMINIGLPAGGEMLLLFVYFAVVYLVIRDLGAASQAGFSIGGRIMQSIFMPTMAVAFAIGPIVGQNFGAGKPERVREACYKGIMLNSMVMLVVTLMMQIAPEPMIRAFTTEAEVIRVGSDFLQIISWNFIMQGVVFTCSGVFQGLGNTRPALLSTFIRLLIFVPAAFLLSHRDTFAIHQIWYVSVLSVFIQGILSFVLVERELKIKLKPVTAASAAAIPQV